jgi:hypothetical protein
MIETLTEPAGVSIRDMLRYELEIQFGGAHRCELIKLLLAEGSHYVGSKKWLPRCGWRRGPAKQCYKSSYRVASKDPTRFTYCEGFATSAITSNPLEHAWVTGGAGSVRALRSLSTNEKEVSPMVDADIPAPGPSGNMVSRY